MRRLEKKKKNKIEIIEGTGRIIGPSIFSPKSGAIAVELANGEIETITSDNLIIATGSRPRSLAGLEIDGKYMMETPKISNNGLFVDSFGNITTGFFTVFPDGRQAIYKITTNLTM